MSVVAIVGSAFSEPVLEGRPLAPVDVPTPFGTVRLHRAQGPRDAYLLFRHGVPHRLLPNQIPYRAHAAALREVGCEALLVTSSVGVMEAAIPLNRPLLLGDLLMPENRLPDGSACTIFPEPTEGQGHLVLDEGLFSKPLTSQISAWCEESGWPPPPRVTFAYVGGPRTKTPAENAYFAKLGAQVNSMSVGPEVVLANELEIPVAGLVVGHKHSVPGLRPPEDRVSMAASLEASRQELVRLVARFLADAKPVPFGNRIHRF